MKSAIAMALLGISLSFIGGYRGRKYSGDTRSRYTPHIGAKERARHAGKPDGAMHGLPYLHRKAGV